MKRRAFLGAAAAGALAVPAAAMPTPRPTKPDMIPLEELSPSQRAAPMAVHEAHAERAATKIKDAILAYRKEMKKACVAIVPPAMPVPYATQPCSIYLHLKMAERLPMPTIPAAHLFERASVYRNCKELLTLGVRYAMAEMLPPWASPHPMPVTPPPHKPMRIVTPRYTWDVDECTWEGTFQQKAMMTLVALAAAPAMGVKDLPEKVTKYHRVFVDPLELFVKREAYMIETFSWCHVMTDTMLDEVPPPSNVAQRGAASHTTQMRQIGLDFKEEQRLMIQEAQYIESLKRAHPRRGTG